MLKAKAFLNAHAHGKNPDPPPGWESEMVDRLPCKTKKSLGSCLPSLSGPNRQYLWYWGPDKDGKQLRDKEGKPRRVQSVRGAWLLYGGFASSGHKCIELHAEAISRRKRPLKSGR